MLTCELEIRRVFGIASRLYVVLYLTKLDRTCALYLYCWRELLYTGSTVINNTAAIITAEVTGAEGRLPRYIVGASRVSMNSYENYLNLIIPTLKGVPTIIINTSTQGIIYDSSNRETY